MLDADDLVFQNRAEQVANIFIKYPEIDWFFHESVPINSDGITDTDLIQRYKQHAKDLTKIDFKTIDFKTNLRNAELPYFAPSTSNLCFSREFLDTFFPLPEIKGISGLAICDFYLRIVAAWLGIGIKSEDYLGVFRRHSNNLYTTQKPNKRRKSDCEILLFTAYYLLINYPELAKLSQKLLSKAICLHWHINKDRFDYSEIIHKCRSNFSCAEQLKISTKAFFYSVKLKYTNTI